MFPYTAMNPLLFAPNGNYDKQIKKLFWNVVANAISNTISIKTGWVQVVLFILSSLSLNTIVKVLLWFKSLKRYVVSLYLDFYIDYSYTVTFRNIINLNLNYILKFIDWFRDHIRSSRMFISAFYFIAWQS